MLFQVVMDEGKRMGLKSRIAGTFLFVFSNFVPLSICLRGCRDGGEASVRFFVVARSLFLIYLLALQLINHRVKEAGKSSLFARGEREERARTRYGRPSSSMPDDGN